MKKKTNKKAKKAVTKPKCKHVAVLESLKGPLGVSYTCTKCNIPMKPVQWMAFGE